MSIKDGDSFRRKGLPLRVRPMYDEVATDDYGPGSYEKPWQRIPSPFILVLFGLYLLLAFLTQLIEDDMPRVIKESELEPNSTSTFSEESAWRYLLQIVGDEPRVAGTRHHLHMTEVTKSMLDQIAASSNLNVKTDWQIASGNYPLGFGAQFINFYENVSNIVAILEGESGFHSNGTTGSSVLFNCHYDSVPYALGASDNAVFCAILTEVLSRLSKRTTKFKHNLIFLFNGAEENPLQGSHAFLQHPWSAGIKAVVNLDAAGMNGKPAVFQVNNPSVLSAYKRAARRPTAQSLGEGLFATGIIPSDTDFRVWRDFGRIYGIDVAFTKWGTVYHTRHDRPGLLRRGVLQGAGDMLLALAADLGDQDMGEVTTAPMVYFDYLTVFLITLSAPAARSVDAAILVVGLASVLYFVWLVGWRRSTLTELAWCTLGRVLCALFGALVCAALTAVMVLTTTQIRYLSRPWLVVPLYWVPYVLSAVGSAHLFDSWRTQKTGHNRRTRALQAQAATRLSLAALSLGMLCVPALGQTRYLLTTPLLVMSAESLVMLTLVRFVKLRAWQHLSLSVLLTLPAALFLSCLSLRLLPVLLPTAGRGGAEWPDYTVAGINVGLAVITCCCVSGIELLFSRARLWRPLAAVGAAALVLMFLPLEPYDEDGPCTQRHYWFHSQITTYEYGTNVPNSSVSGIVVLPQDPLTTVRVRRALGGGRAVSAPRCDRALYCDLPVYKTAMARGLSRAIIVQAGPPRAFAPPPTVLLKSRDCVNDTCTYSFHIVGAPHNLITLWPRAHSSLAGWSLAARGAAGARAGRAYYVIAHAAATYTEGPHVTPLTVTLQIPQSQQAGPAVDISLHSHKIQHPEDNTQEYNSIVATMPQYFNIATILSVRNNYVF